MWCVRYRAYSCALVLDTMTNRGEGLKIYRSGVYIVCGQYGRVSLGLFLCKGVDLFVQRSLPCEWEVLWCAKSSC